jgi:ABC-type branched-subunit amino acid transport system ATPase component
MALIELTGLTRAFGGLLAVRDLDLEIEPGEIRGLIGPNGSGKTTLVNLISGRLRPTRGSMRWKGEDITGLPQHRLARNGIARTFQLPTLFREMTGLENVMMGFYAFARWNVASELLGLPAGRIAGKKIEGSALAIMELVGIEDIKDEPVERLPLGYQRWLGIAMALSIAPAFLMLDEPLGGMNPVERAATMDKVRTVRDSGVTILLVEHDVRAVMSSCGRVTVMNAGRKIAEGSPNTVRNDPAVIDAYLGDEEIDA